MTSQGASEHSGWTPDRVWRARQAVQKLLTELKLKEYLFNVEPRGDHWEARVEFASAAGWKQTLLVVDEPDLMASLDVADARDRLVEAWRPSFEKADLTLS